MTQTMDELLSSIGYSKTDVSIRMQQIFFNYAQLGGNVLQDLPVSASQFLKGVKDGKLGYSMELYTIDQKYAHDRLAVSLHNALKASYEYGYNFGRNLSRNSIKQLGTDLDKLIMGMMNYIVDFGKSLGGNYIVRVITFREDVQNEVDRMEKNAKRESKVQANQTTANALGPVRSYCPISTPKNLELNATDRRFLRSLRIMADEKISIENRK